jgi:hypothetical protein
MEVFFEFDDISSNRRVWRVLEFEVVALYPQAGGDWTIRPSGPNEPTEPKRRTVRLPGGHSKTWDTVINRMTGGRSPSKGIE